MSLKILVLPIALLILVSGCVTSTETSRTDGELVVVTSNNIELTDGELIEKALRERNSSYCMQIKNEETAIICEESVQDSSKMLEFLLSGKVEDCETLKQETSKFVCIDLFKEIEEKEPIHNNIGLSKIGDAVDAGYFTYRVLSVEKMKTIPHAYISNQTADGIFVIVDFEIKNTNVEGHSYSGWDLEIIDHLDRKYKQDTQALFNYLETFKGGAEIEFDKTIMPGISKAKSIVFDVDEDSENLKLEISYGDVFSSDKKYIYLGNSETITTDTKITDQSSTDQNSGDCTIPLGMNIPPEFRSDPSFMADLCEELVQQGLSSYN